MPAKFGALRLALAGLVAGLALSPLTAQAFTLVAPTIKLYWNPNIGYTTSYVQVRGTGQIGTPPGPCGTGTLTFNFYFDGSLIWSRSVTCNATTHLWDTGFSPYIKPPSQAAGTHVLIVNAINAATGGQVGTAQANYKEVQAPPSPVQAPPSAPPSPSHSPSPLPTPSKVGCPASALNLPPAGTGGWADGLIATAMIGAVIPIVGFAMFGPRQLMSVVLRRRRLLMLLGLSAFAAFTLSCTFTSNPTAAVTPSAAASPSCSA